jgi:hypothetical protein
MATMRGAVVRDKYHKNALYRPSPELGTRLCKELIKLFLGIGMLHGKLNGSCYSSIHNVAKSSVNIRYLDIMKHFHKEGFDKKCTMTDMQSAIGLAHDTTAIVLDDLLLLKVLTKSENGKLWSLTKSFKQLTLETGLFE